MNILIELRRRLDELLERARQLLEAAEAEDRDLTAEEQTQWDEANQQAEALRNRIARLEQIEQESRASAGQRTPPTTPTPGNRDPRSSTPAHPTRTTRDEVNSLFVRYIRQQPGVDDPSILAEYRHAAREERASNDTTMNITTAADGGDLVPTGHYSGIIARARPSALPLLMDIPRIPGQGTTVNVPIDNESDSGVFVSTDESNEFDRDAPAVSKVAMTLVKYTKKVDLTYELLQDEDSALLAFLEQYVGKGYAATLNSLMITEALSDGTAGLTLDSATAIGADEVPELLYKLSAEYAMGNVAWSMERATEGYLAGLLSANRFTFAPTPAGNLPGTTWGQLWGLPVFSDGNMGSLTASGKSLLVGNFDYMGMRLDPAMTFLRDPYTRSSYGEVILNYYFRCDFEVLQAAAFQYATHPTG